MAKENSAFERDAGSTEPAPKAEEVKNENGSFSDYLSNVADTIGSTANDTVKGLTNLVLTDAGVVGSGSGRARNTYDPNTKLNMPASTTGSGSGRPTLPNGALSGDYDPANIDRVNYYDKQAQIDLANQQIELARQQYNNSIDRAMDTQANELNRALADAQSMYQVQRGQITADEMNALDNSALYAQARGDQGGIGQAQYSSIQNTAAQNRLAVSQAQTKMATDTMRQISDLRAQGEFERADKMLELTQSYLSELRAIEQYAANYNLSVDQMNTAIAQWEAEYNRAAKQYADSLELSMAELTGAFSDGTPTYAARQNSQQAVASLALSLIQSGVKPTQLSPTQLAALAEIYGMSQSAINAAYLSANP